MLITMMNQKFRLLNKKPVIRNNNKERAKRRLLNTLSLTL